MPTIETTGLWIKGKTKPRKRRYRVSWPDGDDWKGDPTSTVFSCEMTDGDANPPTWKPLGCYSTKWSAQEAADADIGYDIKDEDWSERSSANQ